METPIVGYWNTRAIGEPVRLLLNYVGIDFVDKRYECGPPPDYNKSDWLDTKHTLGLDLPNLPYYIDNNEGVKLTQMHAIMYFLGHKHNMAGNSLQEQTRCCMMMEALHDWFDEFWHVTYCSAPWIMPVPEDVKVNMEEVHPSDGTQCTRLTTRFLKLKEQYLSSGFHRHASSFARALNKESGHGWVAGTTQISYVDFVLFEYVDQHMLFEPKCFDKPEYSSILKFHKTLRSDPRLEAYFTKPREPLHNKYSHFHRGWVET
eukprot:m.48014 g.48014  ORF g.48014 m.48014 type:complete len:261 (+) comp10544_c0_seq4:52-834(+)